MHPTNLPPWIPLMPALALLVTHDPTIAADMLQRPEKKRQYAPPPLAGAEAGTAEERRALLGHPDDWIGQDNLSWIGMWAGAAETVHAVLDRLILAVQIGEIKTLARSSAQAPHQSVAPEAWADAIITRFDLDPRHLVVARVGTDGLQATAPYLADILVSTADLLGKSLSVPTLSDPAAIGRTGFAGRPSSAHLIRQEHGRRLNSLEAHESVAAEARALAFWLENEHPYMPAAKPKSIENNIRDKHRKGYKSPHIGHKIIDA